MGFFHRSNPIDSLKSVLREKGTLFIFRDIPLSLQILLVSQGEYSTG